MNLRRLLSQVFFFFSIVTLAGPLSGPQIIGTGGYVSFGAAITDMADNGIDGPITFTVESGNYPEQIVIPFISGANATNTITFQAKTPGVDNVIIDYSATTLAGNHVIMFDQTQYVKIDGLTINAVGSEFQTCINVANGSRHIKIENCYINSPDVTDPGAVQAEVIKIKADATPTDDIVIRNNKISGGETGLMMFSDASIASPSTGFTIEDNTFENNGTFGIIAQNVNNLKVSRNKFKDSDLAAILSSTTGEVYFNNNVIDFSTAGTNGMIVQTHTIGPGKDEYIYIYNNIFNLKNGYAINLSSAVGVKVAFNTIRAEKTAVSASGVVTVQLSDSLKFTDNIIQNYGAGNAIAIKNSMNETVLDRNIYYSVGAEAFYLDGNLYLNIVAWQTALGGVQDMNSFEGSVNFVDTKGFMLKCNTSTAIKTSIPATTPPPEIDKDINGVVRTNPCWPGAVELVVADDNLVSVSGYVTNRTDTIKDGFVVAFVDSSSKETYDRVGITSIASDGGFAFSDVPALPMYIWIIPADDSYLKSFHDGIIRRENSTPFDPDNCDGITIDIFPRKIEPFVFDGEGLIAGRVKIGGGTAKTFGTDPIPGLDVVLDRIPPSKTVAHTTTDENGYYSFGNLPDGNYVVTIEYEGLEADTMYDIDVVAGDSIFEDKDYCIDTTAQISDCAAPTSINDFNWDHELNLYPNPFNNQLNISSDSDIDRIRIVDVRGLVVYNEKLNGNSIIVNTNHLVPALYFVEFTAGDSRIVKRVIKQ